MLLRLGHSAFSTSTSGCAFGVNLLGATLSETHLLCNTFAIAFAFALAEVSHWPSTFKAGIFETRPLSSSVRLAVDHHCLEPRFILESLSRDSWNKFRFFFQQHCAAPPGRFALARSALSIMFFLHSLFCTQRKPRMRRFAFHVVLFGNALVH